MSDKLKHYIFDLVCFPIFCFCLPVFLFTVNPENWGIVVNIWVFLGIWVASIFYGPALLRYVFKTPGFAETTARR